MLHALLLSHSLSGRALVGCLVRLPVTHILPCCMRSMLLYGLHVLERHMLLLKECRMEAIATSCKRHLLLSFARYVSCWPAAQIVYYDGQFDDARLNVSLACTAALAGAAIMNYAEVTELLKVHVLIGYIKCLAA